MVVVDYAEDGLDLIVCSLAKPGYLGSCGVWRVMLLSNGISLLHFSTLLSDLRSFSTEKFSITTKLCL